MSIAMTLLSLLLTFVRKFIRPTCNLKIQIIGPIHHHPVCGAAVRIVDSNHVDLIRVGGPLCRVRVPRDQEMTIHVKAVGYRTTHIARIFRSSHESITIQLDYGPLPAWD